MVTYHLHRRFLTCLAAASLTLPLLTATPAAAHSATTPPQQPSVVDGNARFQVLSPTLIRVEYADGQRFEDGTTINVQHRPRITPYTTWVANGIRYLKTSRILLTYQQKSGRFTPRNLSLTLTTGSRRTVAHPSWNITGDNLVVPHNQLGGWQRDLRANMGRIPLKPGLLSRDGWQLVVDTDTALWAPGSWPRVRKHFAQQSTAVEAGNPRAFTEAAATRHLPRRYAYQDGYLFGYGLNYKQGLRDLATLTGPSPVLPEWAFGNWYSNYSAFTQQDYGRILGTFRRYGVPLSVLIVDTDFKSPSHWNGWNWNKELWPHPAQEVSWLHNLGVKLGFNIHDGINHDDPKLPGVQQRLHHGLIPNGRGHWWDITGFTWAMDVSKPSHVREFFNLHKDFEAAGMDFFWLDYGCGIPLEEGLPTEKGYENTLPSTGVNGVTIPGLNAEQWQSYLYVQRLRDKGKRGFMLARQRGQWAERRNTVHFTGDTWASWTTLRFESEFTAAEAAALGLPYVSHDIGGHKGKTLPDDLYVRWTQFGAFQPINRPHGDHAARLPWEYSPQARRAGVKFLKLREELVPYLYDLAWEAHLAGIPLVRPLYLEYPQDPAAYTHPDQYMLGEDVLVAPVSIPGKRTTQQVYFPAGRWVDYFTGTTYQGPGMHRVTTTWDTMPVFLREGGMLRTSGGQASQDGKNWLRSDKSIVGVRVNASTPGVDRRVVHYQDDGQSLAYTRGQVLRTPLRVVTVPNPRAASGVSAEFRIGPSTGGYQGMSSRFTYRVELQVPEASSVRVNGRVVRRGSPQQYQQDPAHFYWYDALRGVVHVQVAVTGSGGGLVQVS